MRRAQRKAVALVRRQYQSNDPMRWINIAIIMDVEVMMSPREARIFKRRATRVFRELGINIGKMLDTFTQIVSRAAESIVMIAEEFRKNPDRYKLDLTGKISVEPPKLDIKPFRMGDIYDVKLLTTPTIPPHIIGISVDK